MEMDYFSVAMPHTQVSKMAARPLYALLAGLMLSAVSAVAESVREFDSPAALVRLTLLPAISVTDSLADSAAAIGHPESPLDAITDFTAIDQLVRDGDALMEVQFLDRGSSDEFRFPLKYSELRRHLLLHPTAYQQAELAERNARLFGDLTASLRVQMRDPVEMGEKQ